MHLKQYFETHTADQWSRQDFLDWVKLHDPSSYDRNEKRVIGAWAGYLKQIVSHEPADPAWRSRARTLLVEHSKSGAAKGKKKQSRQKQSRITFHNGVVIGTNNGSARFSFPPDSSNPAPTDHEPEPEPEPDFSLSDWLDDTADAQVDTEADAETDADWVAFEEAYSALDKARKWTLPCGTVVEDKLYEHFTGKQNLSADVVDCIRNWIVDVASPEMQALFTQQEWEEICASVKPIPDVPPQFAENLVKQFGVPGKIRTISDLQNAVWDWSIDNNDPDAFDLRWSSQAIVNFAELIGNHSLDDPGQYAEHWFDTNVWGSILDRCLRSVPDFVLNRAEIQCKSSVLRKNRDRRVHDRLKPALKHDGVLHDRLNSEHEFGLLECSPQQRTVAHSRKWLGDRQKMRRPLRDMLIRLIAEVNYNRGLVEELEVFGFTFSALTLQVSRMTQRNGYVCLLNTYPSVSVPQSLQQLPRFLHVLCHVVQIKRAIARVVDGFRSGSTETNPDDLLQTLLSAGEARAPDGPVLPVTADSPVR